MILHTQTTTHTQTQDSSMTQTHTDVKTYRLAKNGAYQLQPFGPLLTLEQAQTYQADMALGGFDVLVINSKAV